MLDCEPPSTRTEPMSTLILRFLTVVKDPVISCVQFPPSPYTRPCCALASGKINNTTATNLESCFNIHLPVLFTFSADSRRPRPHFVTSSLIKFRKLRQHNTSLRPNVLVLIALCELLQNRTHATIGPHRVEQSQSVGSHAGIGILNQGVEHHIAHTTIALHERAQAIQSLQPHSRIRVIPQRIHQRLANVSVVRFLR